MLLAVALACRKEGAQAQSPRCGGSCGGRGRSTHCRIELDPRAAGAPGG